MDLASGPATLGRTTGRSDGGNARNDGISNLPFTSRAFDEKALVNATRRTGNLTARPGALVSSPNPPGVQGASDVSTTPLKVAVTGAAGQIGYSLLFRLASGVAARRGPPDRAAAARDRAGAEGARGRRDGARRLRVPDARRRRDRRRRRARSSTASTSPCSSARARAAPAWSAATCSRPTARSSPRRARRSTRSPPTTSASA